MRILSLSGVSKHFGGLAAVSDLSFDVEEGAIVGLIGPNGAGKTTVFNLMTGIYRPNGGDISFTGDSLTRIATHRIISLGIARTFQTIRLFQNLLVMRVCEKTSSWNTDARSPKDRRKPLSKTSG